MADQFAGPLPDITDEVRVQLDTALAGKSAGGSSIPDYVRAAIHAGYVGQVVVFCDGCGTEEEGDYIGETREDRFAAARRYLAETKGWATHAGDYCPACCVEMRRE